MNSQALIMLILSTTLLWGGLILAIMHLAKNPEEIED